MNYDVCAVQCKMRTQASASADQQQTLSYTSMRIRMQRSDSLSSCMMLPSGWATL